MFQELLLSEESRTNKLEASRKALESDRAKLQGLAAERESLVKVGSVLQYVLLHDKNCTRLTSSHSNCFVTLLLIRNKKMWMWWCKSLRWCKMFGAIVQCQMCNGIARAVLQQILWMNIGLSFKKCNISTTATICEVLWERHPLMLVHQDFYFNLILQLIHYKQKKN